MMSWKAKEILACSQGVANRLLTFASGFGLLGMRFCHRLTNGPKRKK